MRKFTFFAAVAMTALMSQGAAPKFSTMLKSPSIHAADNVSDEVIWYAPDGEMTWLERSCDGFVTKAYDAVHGQVLGSVVQMVDAGDGEIYLSHMASEYPVETWIKAARVDNTIVVDGAQAIYVEYDYDYDEELMVYLVPMKLQVDANDRGTFVATDDLRFVFNVEEDGSLVAADPEMLLGVCVRSLDPDATGSGIWVWRGFGDRDIKMTPNNDTPLALPEGLEPEYWVFQDQYDHSFVQVAIDGDDFYINGMDRELPDAWIKGQISDGKVIFPSGQFLGADMNIFYYSYFCGAEFTHDVDENGDEVLKSSLAENSVFAYDAENKRLTLERGYVINSTADRLYPLYAYDQVTVERQTRNPEVAPAAPYDLFLEIDDWSSLVWFQLPNTDVDGNLLIENNLFYEIFVNGELQSFELYNEVSDEYEETTRIPYAYQDYDIYVAGPDHTVYLYNEDIVKVGIRSVYVNENGEDIYSDFTYAGEEGSVAMSDGRLIVSERLYDLNGCQVDSRYEGVVVKVITYSDGSERRVKVMAHK